MEEKPQYQIYNIKLKGNDMNRDGRKHWKRNISVFDLFSRLNRCNLVTAATTEIVEDLI